MAKSASRRNFTKARIYGISFINMELTQDEKEIISDIQELLDRLKENFDQNTANLGYKVVRYKCINHPHPLVDKTKLYTIDEMERIKDGEFLAIILKPNIP